MNTSGMWTCLPKNFDGGLKISHRWTDEEGHLIAAYFTFGVLPTLIVSSPWRTATLRSLDALKIIAVNGEGVMPQREVVYAARRISLIVNSLIIFFLVYQ